MGLLDGVLGNASRIDNAEATKEYGRLLSDGEQIHAAYRLIRDGLLLTSTRLILINKQGMTGKKVYYRSVPYRSISTFAVENAGKFDLDAELTVWVPGRAEPFSLTFSRGVDVFEVQALLARFVSG
jgi:hypothetical protein